MPSKWSRDFKITPAQTKNEHCNLARGGRSPHTWHQQLLVAGHRTVTSVPHTAAMAAPDGTLDREHRLLWSPTALRKSPGFERKQETTRFSQKLFTLTLRFSQLLRLPGMHHGRHTSPVICQAVYKCQSRQCIGSPYFSPFRWIIWITTLSLT